MLRVWGKEKMLSKFQLEAFSYLIFISGHKKFSKSFMNIKMRMEKIYIWQCHEERNQEYIARASLGLSGEEPSCQWRRHGFESWSGKMPQSSWVRRHNNSACAVEPSAVTPEPVGTLLTPTCPRAVPPMKEACALQLEGSPCSLLGKSRCNKEDSAQTKMWKINT